MEKNVIYARQRHVMDECHVWRDQRSCAVVTYGKPSPLRSPARRIPYDSRVVCFWQRPGLRGTARSRAVACIRATRRHQWKRTSSMRGNVTYGRIPCMTRPAILRFCAVVTYGKNVTYALAGLQGSEWLSHRTLAERPAPHCGGARGAPCIRATSRHLCESTSSMTAPAPAATTDPRQSPGVMPAGIAIVSGN